MLAWRLATSWWTDSLEDMDPDNAGLLRLLALLTMVATVRQYRALAKASLVEFAMLASDEDLTR